MGYCIDLESISISEYSKKLKLAYLVPSRRILKENIEHNFGILQKMNIKTVFDIQLALKTKQKLIDFSKKSSLSVEYLTILLREINSINPKPNNLCEIPGIPAEIISRLQKAGIKNTFQLYNYIKTKKERLLFSGKFEINDEQAIELTKLTDLSRIKWASPIFVRILYQLGYNTVDKVAKADYETLHREINNLNERVNYFKGNIGLNDTKIFIDAAKDVSLEVEY